MLRQPHPSPLQPTATTPQPPCYPRPSMIMRELSPPSSVLGKHMLPHNTLSKTPDISPQIQLMWTAPLLPLGFLPLRMHVVCGSQRNTNNHSLHPHRLHLLSQAQSHKKLMMVNLLNPGAVGRGGIVIHWCDEACPAGDISPSRS